MNNSTAACERLSTNYAQALGKKLLAEEKHKEIKVELKKRMQEIAVLHHTGTSTSEQRLRLARDYASPDQTSQSSPALTTSNREQQSQPQQQLQRQQPRAARVSSNAATALTTLATYDEQVIKSNQSQPCSQKDLSKDFGVEFLKCIDQLTSCVRRNQPTLLSVLRRIKMIVKDTLDKKIHREKLLVDVVGVCFVGVLIIVVIFV